MNINMMRDVNNIVNKHRQNNIKTRNEENTIFLKKNIKHKEETIIKNKI